MDNSDGEEKARNNHFLPDIPGWESECCTRYLRRQTLINNWEEHVPITPEDMAAIVNPPINPSNPLFVQTSVAPTDVIHYNAPQSSGQTDGRDRPTWEPKSPAPPALGTQ